MASFTFTKGKYLFLTKALDLVNDTIRITIVMTNSSVTTAGQQDVSTISALTTLDQMDGSGYVRKLMGAVTVKAVTQDNTNHRAIFTSDTTGIIWTALGAGTRSMKGAIIYQDTTGTNNDATNIPIFWIDGGFPLAANGTDFKMTPDATTGWTYL